MSFAPLEILSRIPGFRWLPRTSTIPKKGDDVVVAETNEKSATAGIELIIAAIAAGKIEKIHLTPNEEKALVRAMASADAGDTTAQYDFSEPAKHAQGGKF